MSYTDGVNVRVKCEDCGGDTYDIWVGVCTVCGYMYRLHLTADYIEYGFKVKLSDLLPDS